MAAIDIIGLEKTYSVGFWRKRPKRALLPLHLAVEEGEIFGFLGPNGAGKTTTLKLLMGLVFPTSGSGRILGMEWTDPKVKAQIGFLPEQPYFYDYLTARELLEYYAQLSGVPAKERRPRVDAVLHRVGLPDVGGVQLRKFSKGMLQRVGIAQAILHEVIFQRGAHGNNRNQPQMFAPQRFNGCILMIFGKDGARSIAGNVAFRSQPFHRRWNHSALPDHLDFALDTRSQVRDYSHTTQFSQMDDCHAIA